MSCHVAASPPGPAAPGRGIPCGMRTPGGGTLKLRGGGTTIGGRVNGMGPGRRMLPGSGMPGRKPEPSHSSWKKEQLLMEGGLAMFQRCYRMSLITWWRHVRYLQWHARRYLHRWQAHGSGGCHTRRHQLAWSVRADSLNRNHLGKAVKERRA